LGKRGHPSLARADLKRLSKPTPKQRAMLVRTVAQLGRQIEKQGQKVEELRQENQQLKRQIRKLMGLLPHSKRPQ
jgi:predicted RNase H-like nuclease (RuvC/YqgF family)